MPEIFNGSLLAIIFGMISPKSRITEVIPITSSNRPNMGFTDILNTCDTRNVDRITMETFTKLLAIKIVANKVLGLSLSFNMRISLLLLLILNDSRLRGVSEKNAVSDPEMSPDAATRNINMMSDTIAEPGNPIKN